MNFELENWYQKLARHSIKTECVEISQDLLRFFTHSEFIVPVELKCEASKVVDTEFGGDNYGDSETDSDREDSLQLYETVQTELIELNKQLKKSISKLKGFVMPKLGTKAPQDAVWMLPGETMKCSFPEEIYLLLKGSDIVMENAMKSQSTKIYLRQWSNLNPSREFRCFIQNNKVVAVSQRYYRSFFDFLLQESVRSNVLKSIVQLLSATESILSELYQDSMLVIDVYVDTNDRAWLIDIAAFDDSIDCCLYTVAEIELLMENYEETQVEVRVLPEPIAVQPSNHVLYRLPKDIVDLSSQDGIEAFAESMKDGAFDKYQ